MFGAEESGLANVESAIEHVAVAQRIDLLLVAPATADVLEDLRTALLKISWVLCILLPKLLSWSRPR